MRTTLILLGLLSLPVTYSLGEKIRPIQPADHGEIDKPQDAGDVDKEEAESRGVDTVYSTDAADMNLNIDAPKMKGEIFPQTRKQLLKPEDIQEWTDSKLQYAINEMYARRNANFGNKNVKKTFLKFEWYTPLEEATFEAVEARFSTIETSNLKLMADARKKIIPSGLQASTHQSESQTNASVTAGESVPIKFLGQWVFKWNNGDCWTVTKFQNTSSDPISAFKGVLLFHNDFDEVAAKEDYVFSSNLVHVGKDGKQAHPILPPNKAIYFWNSVSDNGLRTSSTSTFVNPLLEYLKKNDDSELEPVRVKNKIKYQSDKVVSSKALTE